MTIDVTLTRWRAHAARGELIEGLVAAVGALLDEHPKPCPKTLAGSCVCDGANWNELAYRYSQMTAQAAG